MKDVKQNRDLVRFLVSDLLRSLEESSSTSAHRDRGLYVYNRMSILLSAKGKAIAQKAIDKLATSYTNIQHGSWGEFHQLMLDLISQHPRHAWIRDEKEIFVLERQMSEV